MTEKDYTNNKDPNVKKRRETLDELSDLDQELFKMSDDLKDCQKCGGKPYNCRTADYDWFECMKCDYISKPEIDRDDAVSNWQNDVEVRRIGEEEDEN